MQLRLAVLALLSALPAQQAAPSAKDLVARMQAWRGDALTTQAGVRAEGRVTVGGLVGTATRELRRDGRYAFLVAVEGRRFGEGADARGGWRMNHSGQIDAFTARDAARRQFRQRGWFEGLAGAEVVVGSSERYGGVECDVLRLEHSWTDPLELLIAEDGRLVAERTQQGGNPQVIEYDDWREVDGVRWPFREVLTSESQTRTVEWQTIASARGDAPARPAHVAIGSIADKAERAELELEIHNGYLFVAGTLQGRPTSFLIDTGASVTVVDREVAEQLQLPLRGEFKSGGAGSKRRDASWGGQVHVQLGPVELRPHVSSFALKEIAQGLGHAVDAVLGRELLLAFAVEIDYAGKRLVLHEPGAFKAPADATAIPIGMTATGHVEVEVALDDLPAAPFVLDTGAPIAVIVNSTYVAAQPSLQDRKGAVAMLGGVGGGNPATMVTFGAVTFGGHRFADVPGFLSRAKKGAMAMRESAGIVGATLLRRFRCVFDVSRGTLWLTPGEGIDAPFAARRRG